MQFYLPNEPDRSRINRENKRAARIFAGLAFLALAITFLLGWWMA